MAIDIKIFDICAYLRRPGLFDKFQARVFGFYAAKHSYITPKPSSKEQCFCSAKRLSALQSTKVAIGLMREATSLCCSQSECIIQLDYLDRETQWGYFYRYLANKYKLWYMLR